MGDIAHFDSNASSFTQKYPPEDIYQIIPECDKYDEDKNLFIKCIKNFIPYYKSFRIIIIKHSMMMVMVNRIHFNI